MQTPGSPEPASASTGTATPTQDAAQPTPSGPQNVALAQLQDTLMEMEDRWRRTLADLDNLRKRVARDQQRIMEDASAKAAREWLPVLDNLDRALSHAPASPDPFVDGIRAVREQALETMAKLGFPRRDDRGAFFDPRLHEAVSAVPAPDDMLTGTVIDVLRPGYGTPERPLRPASVVVATKPD